MTDRRTVLAAGLGLLAAGAGLGITGCSAPTSGSPGASGGAGASGNSVPAKDVPVGGGVVVGVFIVTQPTAGTFQAFSNVCPHQGCPVSQIQGKQIECPCHSSVFSLADGSRVSGPATRGLTSAKASLSGDIVSVAAA